MPDVVPVPGFVQFRVEGHTAPAGSKTAIPTETGVRVKDAAKGGAEWTATVALAATQAMRGRDPLDGPLRLTLTFHRVRPRGQYRTGRFSHLLRDDATRYPDTKPDVLKLARRVEDALSGICYTDDARICQEVLVKVWGTTPAVDITLERIPHGPIQPPWMDTDTAAATTQGCRQSDAEDTSPAF